MHGPGPRQASGDVRITNRQRETHRNSIRVGNLLNLLDKNAHGTLTNNDGEPYQLNSSQVKSIEILLNKALPTLQSIDATVRDETPQMGPAELHQELGKILRALPPEEIRRLMDGDPKLKIIEGEKVS